MELNPIIAFTLIKGRTITTVKEGDTKRYHTTLQLEGPAPPQIVASYKTQIEAHIGHIYIVDMYIN